MSNDNELSFEELTGSSSVEEWTEATPDKELKSISEIAQEQIKLQTAIEEIETLLKAKKEELRLVAEQKLPEAMHAANLMEFVTSDGFKISVNPFYQAHISEKNSADAFSWLQNNGHGGLIKNQVSVNFGKDEDRQAEHAVDTLKQLGLIPSVKQAVHPSTLKAFVKEQLTQGKDMPSETFGIYVGSRSKIERKR